MQILSKNFSLPHNIKPIGKCPTQQVSSLNFKSSKTKFAENLGKELTKHIPKDSIKDILASPKKKTLFFEMIGATIVATVANIVNLMENTDEKIVIDKKIKDKENIKQDKEEDDAIHIIGEKQEIVNTEEKTISPSNIKFERLKGTTPKIENDFQNYVNENFADDNITSDRLKLLFNKFGGSNRKRLFLYEDLTLKSGEILSFILEELKKAGKDTEKINNIINLYQNIQSVENSVPQEKKKPITIKISDEIKEIINRYPNIKSKYDEIISSSKTKQEAEERIKTINEFIHPDLKDLDKQILKKTRQILNKDFSDCIEEISRTGTSLPEYEKVDFYAKLANKELSKEAILTWENSKYNKKILFSVYNNLKSAGLCEESILKIVDLIRYGQLNSININPENKDFKIALPSIKSLNKNFKTIVDVFTMIKNEEVNLKPEENIIYDKESIIENLKKDFHEHGKTTYPNIVKYLYKNKHEVNGAWDFDKRHVDYRFNFLIDALNNEKLFNPNFFSNHCKLRFIERFVLNNDFGDKRFDNVIRANMRELIEAIKVATTNGVEVTTYSNEYVNGILLTIPTKEYGDVKITLDSGEKIHTIY